MPTYDPNVTCLADLIGIAVRRNPNAVAIEFDGGSRTYGQFWERANRCAHAMLALGLGAGDRVVLFANNSPEYLEQRHNVPRDLVKNISAVGALLQLAVK